MDGAEHILIKTDAREMEIMPQERNTVAVIINLRLNIFLHPLSYRPRGQILGDMGFFEDLSRFREHDIDIRFFISTADMPQE